MGSSLLAHLADVSIRSVLLALVAAAVLWALRSKRSAAVSHAVWTVVLCGMLLLFALGPVLPPLPLRILSGAPAQMALPAVRAALPIGGALSSAPAAETLTPPVLRVPAVPARPLPSSSREIVLFVYASVSLAFFGRLLAGSLLVRRLLSGSNIIHDPNAARFAARIARCRWPVLHESASIAIPLTVGWTRPKILLPAGWREWDSAKLEAVLAHEASHVRRRDSLVAFVAQLNRCLFWFHPLAWWIERRLVLLAERACDESCLCVIRDREGYARFLLDMAAAVGAAEGRGSWHALAMAKPSHIRQRIETILDDSRGASRGLTRTGWAAVLLCSVPVVYAAGAVRVEPVAARGQAPTQARQKPAARGVQRPLVLVPVTVTDPRNRFVTGLQEEHFRVFEDSVEQKIIRFSGEDAPLSVGLVLESTGNAPANFEQFRQAVAKFLRVAGPADEFFLVQLKDRPELAAPFTTDTGEIQKRLAFARSKGKTALLDGLSMAIHQMKNAKNPRKAVLVISDAGENNSRDTESEMINLVREADIQIYAIGARRPTAGELAAPGLLSRIAERTGGRFFRVENLNELPNTAAEIGIELRNQYILGYSPANQERNGKYRNVRVNLLPPAGVPPLRALWRRGYYAPTR